MKKAKVKKKHSSEQIMKFIHDFLVNDVKFDHKFRPFMFALSGDGKTMQVELDIGKVPNGPTYEITVRKATKII
jgi:hypothetical protein